MEDNNLLFSFKKRQISIDSIADHLALKKDF